VWCLASLLIVVLSLLCLSRVPMLILRAVVSGFRPEDYQSAEAKLRTRLAFGFALVVLISMAVVILHQPVLLPLIRWIFVEHIQKPYSEETRRSVQIRAFHGDRRIRMGELDDRKIAEQSTLLSRTEDHPNFLRLFQLRLHFYPWRS
jgi:prepilin signal peptidase PulO-like enzyme (type II secretory pathway)